MEQARADRSSGGTGGGGVTDSTLPPPAPELVRPSLDRTLLRWVRELALLPAIAILVVVGILSSSAFSAKSSAVISTSRASVSLMNSSRISSECRCLMSILTARSAAAGGCALEASWAEELGWIRAAAAGASAPESAPESAPVWDSAGVWK